MGRSGQMKIQQMAFMIVAVFLFFILVGLFIIKVKVGNLEGSYGDLQREQAIFSLKTITDMSELNCASDETFCLDKDKIRVMAGSFSRSYDDFWPVSSIEVYKIYPLSDSRVECPATDCNYYKIFDNGQSQKETYSTFVSICERVREGSSTFDRCEIGKLVVGVEIREDNS